MIFYLNGKFLPSEKAKISVLDLGFLRGYGVFDFLRTYNGKPFKLEEHLKRLKNSAKEIGLKFDWNLKTLKDLIFQTLAKNKFSEANIKILITGGISKDQITPEGKPTLAILVYPLAVYSQSFYEKGIKVITVPFTRIFPKAKTTNYIAAILALSYAKKKGALEALYKNEKGEILEGTTSNFFVFKNNVLITPKEEILPGITRQVVLDLAQKEFKVWERSIKYHELQEIDEAFLTASNKEIMPIVKIDNLIIGKGKVGRNTKKLMEIFRSYTLSY